MNILLAIDGSSASDRAAMLVVQLAGQLQSPPTLLMVNVAAPLLPQVARTLVRQSTAESYDSGSEFELLKADRNSICLNYSTSCAYRMPSSACHKNRNKTTNKI